MLGELHNVTKKGASISRYTARVQLPYEGGHASFDVRILPEPRHGTLRDELFTGLRMPGVGDSGKETVDVYLEGSLGGK